MHETHSPNNWNLVACRFLFIFLRSVTQTYVRTYVLSDSVNTFTQRKHIFFLSLVFHWPKITRKNFVVRLPKDGLLCVKTNRRKYIAHMWIGFDVCASIIIVITIIINKARDREGKTSVRYILTQQKRKTLTNFLWILQNFKNEKKKLKNTKASTINTQPNNIWREKKSI